MTYKLLIVDDERANLRLLERLFRHDYYCLTASSGEEAIKLLEQHDVAVIITDQRMPEMTGIELLKQTAKSRPHMVRILLTGYTEVAALVEAVNCGLVYMYVTKPWNNDDLKLRVSRALENYTNNRRRHELDTANQRLLARAEQVKAGFVRSLAEVLRMREPRLHEHSARVSEYALRMSEALELGDEICREIAAAAMLHEIGALGDTSAVECWPGRSGSEASRFSQRQSDRGAEILSGIPDFKDMSDIIRFQHESIDGSGLPRGLMGDQIPIGSRVIRVAAEYDLLVNASVGERSSHAKAIANIRQRSGGDLDARLVDILAGVAVDYPMPASPQLTDEMTPGLLTQTVN